MKPTPAAKLMALFAMAIISQSSLGFYNPATGRWLNRDPIGESGGLGLQSFVLNDPVSKWDKLGLCKCGVDNFVVTWNAVTEDEGRTAAFGIQVHIDFTEGGEFDPSCCEYRQFVSYSFENRTPDGLVLVNEDGTEIWHDDGYDRHSDVDGKPDLDDPGFYTTDVPGWHNHPGWPGPLPMEPDWDVNDTFSAMWFVTDTCNNNTVVATRGPHTAYIQGKYPRTFIGVPWATF